MNSLTNCTGCFWKKSYATRSLSLPYRNQKICAHPVSALKLSLVPLSPTLKMHGICKYQLPCTCNTWKSISSLLKVRFHQNPTQPISQYIFMPAQIKNREIRPINHTKNINLLTNQNLFLSPAFSSYLSLASLYESNFYFFFWLFGK